MKFILLPMKFKVLLASFLFATLIAQVSMGLELANAVSMSSVNHDCSGESCESVVCIDGSCKLSNSTGTYNFNENSPSSMTEVDDDYEDSGYDDDDDDYDHYLETDSD